ncbi:hypothetical protein L3X38_012777 [Prunus dulcis]|uniref:Reverse transcriptase Ty1/copia-type domain-containing protein n=1 Tax=Prunus dulcis TaxID=3755 RepID=A0AAD4WJZ4_PRUDU|nr:hypothetical protein L3X38_012777 [Prunus dulcis]
MTTQTSFSPEHVWIADSGASHHMDKVTKAILLQGKSNQGLYPIPFSASQRSRDVSSISSSPVAYVGQHVNVSIWLQRLGHPINTVVQRMLQDSALSVFVDTSQALCTACLHGKMHKLSFRKDHVKSNVPFQRIHSDLYPLFNKYGVFEEFLKFYALVTNQFKATIQFFQSDGGGEFFSRLFSSFLDSKGIIHQFTHISDLIMNISFSQEQLNVFFMGHSPGYKGVICYNRSTSRFVVSRHVIHDETVFLFKSHSISADSVPVSCSSKPQTLPVCVSLPPCIHALNPSDISGSISPQHVSSQNHSSQNVSISSLESIENPTLSSSDSVVSVINHRQLQILLPVSPSISSSVSPLFNTHAMQTRSKAGIVKSKQFEDYQCYYTTLPVIHDATEPATYKVASQSVHWIQAMKDEIEALHAQGFEDPKHLSYVCKLRKSLYDLKQAPRAWNAKFTSYLSAIGFASSHSDPSLFVKHLSSDIVILLLYVDDIILTGSKVALVQEVVDELSSAFDMKDMGKLKYFLGLQISYNTAGDIFVNQAKYAKDLLANAGLSSRPCPTPCRPHGQLLKTEGDVLTDPTIYRSIVGALQYLTFTRPKIAYVVNTVYQFMTTPSELHFQLVKRIFRNLQGTLDHGLTFTSGAWELNSYIDADWAADISTR